MPSNQYQAPQFDVADTRQLKQGTIEGPGRQYQQITYGDESWRARLFEQLGGQASALLNKAADINYSNLYLEGQAAAGVVASEEELQGSPLTRDWKVAGYRDTMGQLALADTEAQFAADLPSLREKPPEELKKYLAARRDEVMPGFAGMSHQARAAAIGQLLLQDRAAIQTHGSAHTAFLIDEQKQAITTGWSTSLKLLGAAQTEVRAGNLKPAVFEKQLESTAGKIVGSVWLNPRLPEDVRQNLTFEMIRSTLANDSVELYDYITQTEMPDENGGGSTLLSRLDGKQQQQLANGYREAMSRTNDQRNLAQLMQVEALDSQIEAEQFTGTYDDIVEFVEPLVARKVITGERAAGLTGKFLKKQYDAEEGRVGAECAMRGDMQCLRMQGMTEEDGVKAIAANLVKRKADPATWLNTYLQAGKNGLPGGFKEAGKILSSSLRQIRSEDGTVLPQHMQTFKAIDTAITAAKTNGNMNAREAVLSGLPEEDRMFASRIFAMVGDGQTLDYAVGKATDEEAREKAMSPSVRAATAAQTGKAVASAIAEIEPMNVLERVWSHGKAIFSGDAAAKLAISVDSSFGFRDGLFGDSPVVQKYADVARARLEDAASRYMLANPTAKPDAVMSAALADTMANTVQSRHGPIILPAGTDMARTFGVSQANVAAVGPGIDRMLKETKDDARWFVEFTHRGVFAQEYDRDGNPIGNGSYLDPKEVRKAVQAEMQEKQDKANFRYGKGKAVTKDGSTIKFNGNNTAAVSNGWMLEFRENLVQGEGIRDTPYEDQTGKKDQFGRPIKTVGIGVASHNPRYPQPGPDGKVSQEAIRKSFLLASDDAAVAGRRAARGIGMDNNRHAFLLMSELAYQSGTSFHSAKDKSGKFTRTAQTYQTFLMALKSKDAAAAKAAFQQTAAWYWSADRKQPNVVTDRQKHYLQLIDKTINGG